MNLSEIFTQNVKFFRKKRGFSQEKLAEKCGLHRTYISLVERNKRNITIRNIEKIANALDIDAYELLKERSTLE